MSLIDDNCDFTIRDFELFISSTKNNNNNYNNITKIYDSLRENNFIDKYLNIVYDDRTSNYSSLDILIKVSGKLTERLVSEFKEYTVLTDSIITDKMKFYANRIQNIKHLRKFTDTKSKLADDKKYGNFDKLLVEIASCVSVVAHVFRKEIHKKNRLK